MGRALVPEVRGRLSRVAQARQASLEERHPGLEALDGAGLLDHDLVQLVEVALEEAELGLQVDEAVRVLHRGTIPSPPLSTTAPGPLRAITYLSPGVPRALFELVCEHLGRALGRAVVLEEDGRTSGPMHARADPFAPGSGREPARADLGFVCSPSYLWLRAQARPSVELVPAGFVFRDPRHGREPVYWSELVVQADHPARSLEDLEGRVWGYNDECSLSGYFATLQELAARGCGSSFFAAQVRTGSHLGSIEALLKGSIDGAAIDSTVLARLRRERPELRDRLRVLASLGPFPIQPVVLRVELAATLGVPIAAALLRLGADPAQAARMRPFDLEGCAPLDDRAFEAERQALRRLGKLPG